MTVAMRSLLPCFKYYIVLYFRELTGMTNVDTVLEVKFLFRSLKLMYCTVMRRLRRTSLLTEAKCMLWKCTLTLQLRFQGNLLSLVGSVLLLSAFRNLAMQLDELFKTKVKN